MDGYDIKCSFELLFLDFKKYGPSLMSNNEDRLISQRKKFSTKMNGKPLMIYEKTIALYVITKLDRIVLINKLDYLNKMKELISDETKLS